MLGGELNVQGLWCALSKEPAGNLAHALLAAATTTARARAITAAAAAAAAAALLRGGSRSSFCLQ